MKTLSHISTSLLLALAASAQAQTVYRCGNSYSQEPCPGGTTVNAADERTAEQRKAHENTVRQDVRTAAAMERERLKQEAAAARAAQQAAKVEQKEKAGARAAQKTPAHRTKNPHAQDKLPAYRAPVAPKPPAH